MSPVNLNKKFERIFELHYWVKLYMTFKTLRSLLTFVHKKMGEHGSVLS
jgi:hypothetical protein